MKSSLSLFNRNKTVCFRIVGLTIAVAPMWLMLSVFNTSACAQTSNDISASSGATTASSPADWIEFLRDNMQRWNPYETVLGVNNVSGLQVKWKNPIGAAAVHIPSAPAVVNGVIYFGSDDNNVYALNASTGAKLWSYTTGNAIGYSSPAVVNGVVYVGSEDRNVYALNASTGAKLWSYITGDFVAASPSVVNGVVYIGSDALYALDATTGAKLWSFPTGGGGVSSSPAVANGVVYFGSFDRNTYALNASTGVKLWSYPASGNPAVANGVVYVGSDDGNVYALNASTGAKLWSFATGVVESAPAVANGVVYAGSDNRSVYALNASTGVKLWSFATNDLVSPSPAVANGVVYVGSDDGNVYALNASTGAKLWSYVAVTAPAGSAVISSPTIVDGVLYIRGGIDNFSEPSNTYAFALGGSVSADLFLRIFPSTTTVHQGDLLTYAFPVWNLGPNNADFEVLNTQVPAGTIFEYIRISGTPGLGTCTRPAYHGTGQVVCRENAAMAPNTTWTVRLTVKVTAAAGSTITANAATMASTPDPKKANNMATVSLKVQ